MADKSYTVNFHATLRDEADGKDDPPRAEATLTYRKLDSEQALDVEERLIVTPLGEMLKYGREQIGK